MSSLGRLRTRVNDEIGKVECFERANEVVYTYSRRSYIQMFEIKSHNIFCFVKNKQEVNASTSNEGQVFVLGCPDNNELSR